MPLYNRARNSMEGRCVCVRVWREPTRSNSDDARARYSGTRLQFATDTLFSKGGVFEMTDNTYFKHDTLRRKVFASDV